MITWVLIILLGVEPFPTFGVLGAHKTQEACQKELKQIELPKEELRQELRCLPVVTAPVKET